MKRRQFLQALTILGLSPKLSRGFSRLPNDLYQLPPFGNTRLLHFTDCHAQLLPVYYREPQTSFAVGASHQAAHLNGHAFLDFFGIQNNTRNAHAFTPLDFVDAARKYGKMGGFAHLHSLIQQLRNESGIENTLLLDGGDSWQGSATALWTSGQDMLQASNLLGVDVMTGHWEFTYGQKTVLDNLKQFQGDFVAQNVSLNAEALFNSESDNAQVFKPYVIKELAEARVAIIGQAFPYTPIANPRHLIPDWQFGIQEQNLQKIINEIQTQKQADVIVLLSHNGLDVDLKLASRVSGLDIILGGHTHNALPKPQIITNSGGKTWVTNAGSHGKFLAVFDLDIRNHRLHDLRYQLMPVFSNLLTAEPQMQALIDGVRKPFIKQLRKPLAISEQLLYRRDTFMGTFDQLILDALLEVNDAEIALSAGFRWGSSILPQETIYFEDVMNHTAITYPNTYTNLLSGQQIKAILEDVADNLFNPDPYYRQGGDMVRVGGLTYRCDANAKMGKRITELRFKNGRLLEATKIYKVAGWASVNSQADGRPVWDVVSDFLLNIA